MKAFVIATLFIATCSAYGTISTQYQAQDGLGGYSYGYSDPLSTKHEAKSHDGSLHGGYSYVDANGHIQSVKYVADPHHGFQVVSATNLPKAPVHTPVISHAPIVVPHHSHYWGIPSYAPVSPSKTQEVLAAEHEHFLAHAEAKNRLHHHHKRSAYGVPIDTPEVQHEKAIHFAAHQRALQGLPANPIVYHPQLAWKDNHHATPISSNYNNYNHWAHQPAPTPVNGIPIDTAEVQHAKSVHFALVADAKSKLIHSAQYAPAHDEWKSHNAYQGPYHYPTIHNGVPDETPEVKAEKSKHFALVAEAKKQQPHYGHYKQEDDGSYDSRYENNEQYWH